MLDVATEASQNFPRERMRRELARMGTAIELRRQLRLLGADARRARARYFDRSWEIFTDVGAAGRASRRKTSQRVKNRMLVSLCATTTDTPDSFLQCLQSRVAYAGHPVHERPARHGRIGRELTLEDVRRYHQQMMQTSRLLLVVVGDVDPQGHAAARSKPRSASCRAATTRPSPLPAAVASPRRPSP